MSEVIVEPKNKASDGGYTDVASGGKGTSTPRTDPNQRQEHSPQERHANGQQDSPDVDITDDMVGLQVEDERFSAEENAGKSVSSLDENNSGKQITGNPGPLPDSGKLDIVNDSGRDNVAMSEEKTSRLLQEAPKNDVVRLDDPGNLRMVKKQDKQNYDSVENDDIITIEPGTKSKLLHKEGSSTNGNICDRTESSEETFATEESTSGTNSQFTEEGSTVELLEGAMAESKPTSLEGATANSEPKRPDSIPLVNSIDLYRRLHDPLSGIRTEGRREEEKKGAAGGSWGLAQQGFVSREGDMVSFVATDLTQKIKKSTPNRQTNDPELELILGQKEHTAATSEAVGSRKATDMPPIDPRVLVHLEKQAKQVSESLEIMMGNLRGTLHSMSAITVGCMQTHRDMVESLGDTTDLCVKAMYTLIARCEELNNSMKPVHEIAQQIKDIKKQLEAFEALCK
ncbi:PREDICTED: uncharacterized protein LOC109476758 isoform X1 [Branchiostoma belcheri]|uniref:Uncharacterized protein LOC109476758 isoform X1 n=1 Tax=Branchiostoma belcheri TaxID=7741 RepID=A0A6P4ZQV8_BRABE|nr:PREDICTED: uncharacterized protein LOC109476758 isoform X1 [Branchiostoma belcheri]